MDEHMLRAAARARPALAVLTAELGEPSPDMAQALATIEQMLCDIEAGQATRLDGRACRAIYEDARQRIDWQAMPPHEREFAQRLGVGP